MEGQISKGKMFWRIQKELLRRSITPYLMYLMMSLLMLSFQAITAEGLEWLRYILSAVCIGGGMFFNGHLCYHYGIMHYDAYITGCLHRRNALFGIVSGGDHREEREFRWWKGFVIGFYVGLPVILIASLCFIPGVIESYVPQLILDMFAGWAIIPFQWFREALPFNYLWLTYSAVLLPVLVSGAFYLIGALVEKRKKEEETERSHAVEEAGKRARK